MIKPLSFWLCVNKLWCANFLRNILQFAPAPYGHKTRTGEEISPYEQELSGFVFKIQANMNPAHRDRIAFVRICSGTFERGMDVTLERTGKNEIK